MDRIPEFLEQILGEAGIPADSFQWIEGAEIPPPYRDLLVHKRDMTSTLAEFHKTEIDLDVLNVSNQRGGYAREVVLIATSSGKPVEYGAIVIQLDHFSNSVREAIVLGKEPLGNILSRMGCAYQSRPRGFFSIHAPKVCQERFGCSEKTVLYGRCNQLVSTDEKELASIIEILPVS